MRERKEQRDHVREVRHARERGEHVPPGVGPELRRRLQRSGRYFHVTTLPGKGLPAASFNPPRGNPMAHRYTTANPKRPRRPLGSGEHGILPPQPRRRLGRPPPEPATN